MKKILIVIFCLSMISCGNKKPNTLEDGVVDKSNYPFPPKEESNHSKEN